MHGLQISNECTEWWLRSQNTLCGALQLNEGHGTCTIGCLFDFIVVGLGWNWGALVGKCRKNKTTQISLHYKQKKCTPLPPHFQLRGLDTTRRTDEEDEWMGNELFLMRNVWETYVKQQQIIKIKISPSDLKFYYNRNISLGTYVSKDWFPCTSKLVRRIKLRVLSTRNFCGNCTQI